MSTRPLIIAARYKLLFALPFLVILPLAVVFSLLNRTTEYVSVSTLWAEQSTLIDTLVDNNNNLSPAQNRANDLSELLRTETFVTRVAKEMGLPTTTATEIARASSIVRKGTAEWADGRHLVNVQNTGPDRERSQKIVQAIVKAFRDQYSEDTRSKAANAESVAVTKLATQQAALTDAQTALSDFIGSQPASANVSVQPRYIELQSAAKLAQTRVEATQQQLAQIDQLAKNTTGAQDVTLRVYDEPSLPLAPKQISKRTLIAIPIAGLLLALSLSSALFAFLLKTDNSIRVAEDLKALPGLLLLGTVPDVSSIKQPGWPKNFFRVAVTALGLHPQP
jgi:capsular polysaccharide biosynthesis protein